MKRATKLLVLLSSVCVATSFLPTHPMARVPLGAPHTSTNALPRAAGLETRLPGHVLVGNISEALRLLVSRSNAATTSCCHAFKFSDVVVILGLSFLPEYLLRFFNNHIANNTYRRKNPLELKDTPYLAPISKILCQIGQLGLYVYLGELFMVFLSVVGVPGLQNKPKLLAYTVYGIWGARKLSQFKTHLMDRVFDRLDNRNTQKNIASRKTLYNRTLDVIIYLVMILLFLDANSINVGVAVKSILTLGGVSSAVIGLALKDPVSEIITGTSVLLSDKFATGEVIRLSDGTTGKVQDFQWTDISVQASDDSSVRIPHTQLAKQHITNLSRTPDSVVYQQIRMPYRGATKIKRLVDDMKREIRTSCPKLIQDDNRTLLVHWTDFEKDTVVITIEAFFRIARLSPAYWDNRQEALLAISRAVDKYNA